MTDPISVIGLIGSCASIAAEGHHLYQALQAYCKSVKQAKKEVRGIAQDVNETAAVLKQVSQNLELEKDQKLCNAELYTAVNDNVETCAAVFSEIKLALTASAQIQWKEGGQFSSLNLTDSKRLRWPLNHKKVSLLQSNLDRLRVRLDLMINVVSYTRDVQNSKKIKNMQIKREELQLEQADERYLELKDEYERREREKIARGTSQPKKPLSQSSPALASLGHSERKIKHTNGSAIRTQSRRACHTRFFEEMPSDDSKHPHKQERSDGNTQSNILAQTIIPTQGSAEIGHDLSLLVGDNFDEQDARSPSSSLRTKQEWTKNKAGKAPERKISSDKSPRKKRKGRDGLSATEVRKSVLSLTKASDESSEDFLQNQLKSTNSSDNSNGETRLPSQLDSKFQNKAVDLGGSSKSALKSARKRNEFGMNKRKPARKQIKKHAIGDTNGSKRAKHLKKTPSLLTNPNDFSVTDLSSSSIEDDNEPASALPIVDQSIDNSKNARTEAPEGVDASEGIQQIAGGNIGREEPLMGGNTNPANDQGNSQNEYAGGAGDATRGPPEDINNPPQTKRNKESSNIFQAKESIWRKIRKLVLCSCLGELESDTQTLKSSEDDQSPWDNTVQPNGQRPQPAQHPDDNAQPMPIPQGGTNRNINYPPNVMPNQQPPPLYQQPIPQWQGVGESYISDLRYYPAPINRSPLGSFLGIPILEAWILRRAQTDGQRSWLRATRIQLPIPQIELQSIVKRYLKKRKSVWAHVQMLSTYQQQQIRRFFDGVSYYYQANLFDWNLVALETLPRKTRGPAIESIQLIIERSRPLAGQLPFMPTDWVPNGAGGQPMGPLPPSTLGGPPRVNFGGDAHGIPLPSSRPLGQSREQYHPGMGPAPPDNSWPPASQPVPPMHQRPISPDAIIAPKEDRHHSQQLDRLTAKPRSPNSSREREPISTTRRRPKTESASEEGFSSGKRPHSRRRIGNSSWNDSVVFDLKPPTTEISDKKPSFKRDKTPSQDPSKATPFHMSPITSKKDMDKTEALLIQPSEFSEFSRTEYRLPQEHKTRVVSETKETEKRQNATESKIDKEATMPATTSSKPDEPRAQRYGLPSEHPQWNSLSLHQQQAILARHGYDQPPLSQGGRSSMSIAPDNGTQQGLEPSRGRPQMKKPPEIVRLGPSPGPDNDKMVELIELREPRRTDRTNPKTPDTEHSIPSIDHLIKRWTVLGDK